jgi:hypothetical protein
MAVNVITGAKAILKVDGRVLGYATGLQISEMTLNGRVDSLGFIDSREITPISRVVQASCAMIRIFQTNANNGSSASESDEAGAVPNSGANINRNRMINTSLRDPNVAEVDINVRTDEVFDIPPFDLEVYDSAPGGEGSDDIKMYTVKECRIQSHNIMVDRSTLMGVQCVLEGTYLIRHQIEQ